MAKKPPEVHVSKTSQTAHKNVPAHTLKEAFGVSDTALLQQKINEIAKLLWVHEGASEERKHERIVRALELYESLEPADGAEGMLAMQMVGTHDAALECLKRAALPGQTFEGRDMALKHAHKLMSLYTQQLATLNKHRGKGQQKVTVEHVNVQAGGQAIVGNVEAGQRGGQQRDADPAIEHRREVPVSGDNPKTKVPRNKGSD